MNKSYQKFSAKKTIFTGFMIAAILTSCSGNNEEPVTEVQTNTSNIENIKKGKLNGQTITYERKNGMNFFQGDIVLSDKQLSEGNSEKKGGATLSRWPGGVVYYTVVNNMGTINADKIDIAVNEYNNLTNVQWVPRTNQPDYVEFIFGSPFGSDGWAAIGYQGGRQYISLDQHISIESIIHEMGHAIGLYHEHARQDRDDHITILWENIRESEYHNFEIYDSGIDIGPFNINSMMMYWPHSYSKNGLPTIIRADNTTFTYNRVGFTEGDILTINAMYPNF
ncbi:M12 family metallopeptidase [Chryseobacterium indologenes]|uniref:M12 family metallopeptidase n=1 Tax=Chryseobacterium indologenes TaxID=253 RepID=UPI00078820A9|nr:M12 family metallopeptidase [Chryseobacterium indologenes]